MVLHNIIFEDEQDEEDDFNHSCIGTKRTMNIVILL
jgi:hypothetical protein